MRVFRNLLFGLILVFSLGLSASAVPIHFVAELADDVDFESLEEKFATALAEYLNSDCGPEAIDIDVLDFRTFYQLSKLTGSSWYAATNYGSAANVVPTDNPREWELRLNDADLDLKTLTLIDGDGEKHVFDGDSIGGIGDTDKPVRLRIPGIYDFSLPDGFNPVNYEVEAVYLTEDSEGNSLPPVKVLAKWPNTAKYCLIKIDDGCVDNNADLLNVMKDYTKMGEPITVDGLAEGVQLYAAKIGNLPAKEVTFWDENELTMKVRRPEGRDPKRVWVSFPITESEATAKLESLKKEDGRFKSGTEISQIIRSQGTESIPNIPPGTTPVYPSDSPSTKWFELPAFVDGNNIEWYQGTWNFTNPDAEEWRPRNYRVYVFEFEYPSGKTEAVSVAHPVTEKMVRAVEEEFSVWNKKRPMKQK